MPQDDPTAIVVIVNRAPVATSQTYAGRVYTWAPGERMHLPWYVASHCVRRSIFRLEPMSGATLPLLGIEGEGDTSPIPPEMITLRGQDYFDRSQMPPTVFQDDGTPIPQSAARVIAVTATEAVARAERQAKTRDAEIRAAVRDEGLAAPMTADEVPLPPS